MHPTLEDLLALRDGDGHAAVRRHVEDCDQCRTEIEGLRAVREGLRALPQCPPPGRSWEAIQQRIAAGRRRSVNLRLGIAAAVLLGLATAAILGRFGPAGDAVESVSVSDTREVVEQLSKASRELEMVLQDGSLRSPVLSPRQAAMIVELEDRIALVDLALSESRESEPDVRAVALWSDRVELLDALVTARSSEERNDSIVWANNRNERSR